jgi:ketosteroid isomerase-like protein
MKKYLWAISAIILLALASCQEKAEFTDEQKAAIEKEVKIQNDGIISALNQLDFNALSEYFSKDEFISVNSGVNYFSTRSAFIDSVTYWFSQRERQQVELVEVRVTALTSELALMTNKLNWDISLKSGENLKSKAIVSSLWKKEQAGWKQIHMHESWAIFE